MFPTPKGSAVKEAVASDHGLFSLVQIGLASLPRVSYRLPAPPTLRRWLVACQLPATVLAPGSTDLVSVACRVSATSNRIGSLLLRPCVGGLSRVSYQQPYWLPAPPTLCRWLVACQLPATVLAPGSSDLVSVACRVSATSNRIGSRLFRPCVGGLSPGSYQQPYWLPAPPTLCRWLVACQLPATVLAPGSTDLVSVACRVSATSNRIGSRLLRPCVGGLSPGSYQQPYWLPAPPTLCRWLVACQLPATVLAPGSTDLVSVACRVSATSNRICSGASDLVSVACRVSATSNRICSRRLRPCVGGLSRVSYQQPYWLPAPPTLCRWLVAWQLQQPYWLPAPPTLCRWLVACQLPATVLAPGSSDLVSVACRVSATSNRIGSRLHRPCVGGLSRVSYQQPYQITSVEEHAHELLPPNRDRNGARPTFWPRRHGFPGDTCASADWFLMCRSCQAVVHRDELGWGS